MDTARYACSTCLAVFRTGLARCPLDGSPLLVVHTDPLEGITLADRYRIEQVVGEGTTGRVYRARHARVSRQFAIKVLFGEHAADDNMRTRFAREAEMASRLDHPNTVGVLDYGETQDGLCYLVMDWVEGRELRELLIEEAPLSRSRCLDLTRQICAGLGHAHRAGLVHRDLKSENVLVTLDRGREIARIVDFGIAVLADMADSERLTTEGIVVGTPAYMSPEHVTGGTIDERADLFALGVVMYEMLSGTIPFEGSAIEIARANLSRTPPAIADRVPGLEVDPRLEAVAMQLMAKNPGDRYQSADEVIEALEPIDRPPAESTSPTEMVEIDSIEPPTRRRRLGAIAIGFAAAALVAVLLAAGTGDDGPGRAAPDLAVEATLSSDVSLAARERPRSNDAERPRSNDPESEPPADDGDADADADADTRDDPAPVAVHAPASHRAEPDRDHPPTVATNRPAPDTEPPRPTPKQRFERRYRRIGALLDSVPAGAQADALNKKYMGIPYSDALRNAGIRRDAENTLASLEAALSGLRKPPD